MSTRARIRRTIDPSRLGELASGPGVDTRSWIVLGRVDDDEDAIRWSGDGDEDGPIGWVVDVTVVDGGDLTEEVEVPCRLGSAYARDKGLRSDPPSPGCLVVVALPTGSLLTEPTIVGELPTLGCEPPRTVNGKEVDETYALATHFFKTALDVDEEIGGTRRIKTDDTHRLLGPSVELADEGASQAYVRGNDQQSALDTWYNAFITWIGLVQTGIVAGGGTLDNTAIIQATTQLTSDLQAALSTRITGE